MGGCPGSCGPRGVARDPNGQRGRIRLGAGEDSVLGGRGVVGAWAGVACRVVAVVEKGRGEETGGRV